MSKKLSPQKVDEVYEFIVAFIGRNGYGPTCREICDMCGVASTSTASYYIDRLVRERRLVKDSVVARGLRLPIGHENETHLRRRLIRVLRPIFETYADDYDEVARAELRDLEALYRELTSTVVPA